jgi:TonB family protein
VKQDSFTIPFVSSCVIHITVIFLTSIMVHNNIRRQDYVPIELVDLPRTGTQTPIRKVEPSPEIKKLLPPTPKVEKPKETKPVVKNEMTKLERSASSSSVPVKEEPAKTVETKSVTAIRTETTPSFASGTRVEGGGSEAGVVNLFGKGDVGVVPGSGTAGGGGGTAVSGLGRGSGVPGLPAQTAVLKTNREARPLQTVRASYPPMALRMGMEGDVTLRVEVDPDGKVTRAEIIKGAGAGFDEEALKAVKQARFEPAQKDGQNVPAEFTYIYRFRLQR